jgi:hypothetical protein
MGVRIDSNRSESALEKWKLDVEAHVAEAKKELEVQCDQQGPAVPCPFCGTACGDHMYYCPRSKSYA